MKLWIAIALFVASVFLMQAGLAFLAFIAFIGVILTLFLPSSSARVQERVPSRALGLSDARFDELEAEEFGDYGEKENVPILVRTKAPKIPDRVYVRLKPDSKRRDSWELTSLDAGDVFDSVFGTAHRIVTGKHEKEGKGPWQAGRGR